MSEELLPILDEFGGNNETLRDCIASLIRMNDKGALFPHGIGGHARAMLAACYHRLNTRAQSDELERLTKMRDLLIADKAQTDTAIREIAQKVGIQHESDDDYNLPVEDVVQSMAAELERLRRRCWLNLITEGLPV